MKERSLHAVNLLSVDAQFLGLRASSNWTRCCMCGDYCKKHGHTGCGGVENQSKRDVAYVRRCSQKVHVCVYNKTHHMLNNLITNKQPLACRHDSICGSAASRGKIRHMRFRLRIDQVTFGINRRWQERGIWFARVEASSIAGRYSLWIRGIFLLGKRQSCSLLCIMASWTHVLPQDRGTFRSEATAS